MYGADWCSYCLTLRDAFIANGIDFLEIDVEKSSEKQRILRTMEINYYPTTWVGYTRVNGITLKDVKKVIKNI